MIWIQLKVERLRMNNNLQLYDDSPLKPSWAFQLPLQSSWWYPYIQIQSTSWNQLYHTSHRCNHVNQWRIWHWKKCQTQDLTHLEVISIPAQKLPKQSNKVQFLEILPLGDSSPLHFILKCFKSHWPRLRLIVEINISNFIIKIQT